LIAQLLSRYSQQLPSLAPWLALLSAVLSLCRIWAGAGPNASQPSWASSSGRSVFLRTRDFFVPETFEPVLLQQRAKRLRYETKNWTLHAKSEEKLVGLKVIAHNYLLRPFVMLALEPILVLVTLYMGFIYGFLYLCFEAYPISFQEECDWNMGVGELPFIAITVGVLCGCGIIIFSTKVRFQRVREKFGKVIPEEWLISMMIGGVLLPAGMFCIGWTSSPSITWVPQVISVHFWEPAYY